MSDELNLNFTPGADEAEKYFNSLPEQLKGLQAYHALLHCFGQHRLFDKAEVVFEKIKELGFEIGIRVYNTILSLCFRTGNYGKMEVVVKGMEEKGIEYNHDALAVRLHYYAGVSEIGRMEEVLWKMEEHPLVVMSWRSYVISADVLVKVGELDKALELLRKSEKYVSNNSRKVAYEQLLSLYAGIGKRDEVDRILGLYRSMVKSCSYRHMIVALLNMDDIDGAEKLVEEYESASKFDIQIANLMVGAYCNKGYFERAKSFIEKLAKSGKENVSTWSLLGKGYYRKGCSADALEAIKKAASLPCQPGWRFNHSTLAACLVYLKEKGDVEAAQELLRLLTENGHITATFCGTLKGSLDGETQFLSSLPGENENHLEIMDKTLDEKMESSQTIDNGAQQCG